MRAGYFEGPDRITALRIRGAEAEYSMLAGQARFALGTQPSCEIAVDRKYVSSLHAVLERRENRIRISDVSKNGIFYRGRAEKQFDIGPGDSFTIADLTFYALNDEMRLARPVIAEILGAHRIERIDDLLLAAVQGGHILVISEPGNDQERLARAIHHASLRRRHHFVKARPTESGHVDHQLLEYAEGGTLWLDLEAARVSVDAAFVERLVAPDANVRVVVCARSLELAQKSVGLELITRAHHVAVAPLRERAGEIASLVERRFIEQGASMRFSDFTEANQAALVGYRWPGNLEQLRDAADRLLVMAPCTTERAAAAALKTPRTTLQRWLDTLGLDLPLVRRPEQLG